MKKEELDLSVFSSSYCSFKDKKISGRLLTHRHIQESLKDLSGVFKVEEIGKSALGNPVHSISFGSGKIKILAWSQMHGNESTTTKAVFDLLGAVQGLQENLILKTILEKISLKIIPILNPDGAIAYTRENANKIDLNRDAQDQKEVESRLLRREFDSFEPHFCFNLHDQRTIFSAGEAAIPAVLSFLTPAMDQNREVTSSRKESMKVIVAMNKDLQEFLPNQIGRYDDAFNHNCTGDTFQSLEVPTILFEAGHFPGDYERERTREFVTYAMISALHSIATGNYKQMEYEQYFDIPENRKLFFDVILRRARVDGRIVDVALQFKETPDAHHIHFIPFLEQISPSLDFYGHKEIDCRQMEVSWEGATTPDENVIVSKILVNNEILVIN